MFTLFQLVVGIGLVFAAVAIVYIGLLIVNGVLAVRYREEDERTWQQYRDANK